MNLLYIYLLIISCNKTDNLPSPPMQENKPVLVWKSIIDSIDYVGSINPCIYDDKIVVSSKKFTDSKEKIIGFDSLGKRNWEWNDQPNNSSYSDNSYRKINEYLILSALPSGILSAINIKTGKTFFQKNGITSNSVDTVGNKIIGSKLNNGIDNLFMFDLNNIYKEENLYNGKYKDYSIFSGGLTWYIVNNDTIIFYTQAYFDKDYKNFASSIVSYNLTKNKLLFDTIVAEYKAGEYATNYNLLNIIDNKLYCQARGVVFCLNPINLEIIWKSDLRNWSRGMSLSGLLFADNKIFLIDDEATYVHCLDRETGNPLWKTKSSGNCSKLNYYNGQIIYASGGDGLIHCLDANTGVYKWKLESPDVKKDSGLFFSRGCTIDEKTGRLYATNYRYLLCYQLPK